MEEFVKKAIKCIKDIKELENKGVISIGSYYVHLRDENFYRIFKEYSMSYHDKIYPIRCSVTIDGIEFFCLDTDLREEK